MEEFSDRINAMNSPRELAIKFLLRHARCRMVLSSEADEARQRLLAALHLPDPASQLAEAAGGPEATVAAVKGDLRERPIAAEETCAARFARAYAAARHMSTSGRKQGSGKKAAA